MTARYVLIGEVLAPEPLGRAAVIMEGANILDVVRNPRGKDLPRDRRNVPGRICPGFIDLQTNGSFGVEVGPDAAGLARLAARLPETGTTSFLPTAISWPAERYGAFLGSLERASKAAAGARVLGAHVEGPFLSPARKGAHDSANLRPVDPGLIRNLLEIGLVKVMTVAPELPGAAEAAKLLREGGAVASVGHTDATYEEVLRGLDAGFSKATHLYNAMSPFTHRAPGAAGAVLDDDRVRAGIIADGVHSHEGALRVAYRQKGPEGLALVTDAMEAAGMPPGEYELSGRKVRLEGSAVRLPDGTLAGSALTMDAAVRNATRILHIPIHDAVRMATETPADVLGLREKGRIVPGADADLVVLGPGGIVEETMVAGKTLYERRKDGDGQRP